MDLLLQELETDYTNLQRAQERLLLQVMVADKQNELSQKGLAVENDLHIYQEEMNTFTAATLVQGLDQGLVGLAADAAKNYLISRAKPDLQGPLH